MIIITSIVIVMIIIIVSKNNNNGNNNSKRYLTKVGDCDDNVRLELREKIIQIEALKVMNYILN